MNIRVQFHDQIKNSITFVRKGYIDRYYRHRGAKEGDAAQRRRRGACARCARGRAALLQAAASQCSESSQQKNGQTQNNQRLSSTLYCTEGRL